ncbi:DNA methyltransferase 3 isoform X4 [Megachile rotundata]|uniref:DNA methyltransferase 3 isoform X4 n=1 Tax=Megachile rotundata TaxID=143995 RepID=UPI003FD1D624
MSSCVDQQQVTEETIPCNKDSLQRWAERSVWTLVCAMELGLIPSEMNARSGTTRDAALEDNESLFSTNSTIEIADSSTRKSSSRFSARISPYSSKNRSYLGSGRGRKKAAKRNAHAKRGNRKLDRGNDATIENFWKSCKRKTRSRSGKREHREDRERIIGDFTFDLPRNDCTACCPTCKRECVQSAPSSAVRSTRFPVAPVAPVAPVTMATLRRKRVSKIRSWKRNGPNAVLEPSDIVALPNERLVRGRRRLVDEDQRRSSTEDENREPILYPLPPIDREYSSDSRSTTVSESNNREISKLLENEHERETFRSADFSCVLSTFSPIEEISNEKKFSIEEETLHDDRKNRLPSPADEVREKRRCKSVDGIGKRSGTRSSSLKRNRTAPGSVNAFTLRAMTFQTIQEHPEPRRVTRGSTKVDKDRVVGKLVWGCCSGWWPALIIDADHVGMLSETGKVWVYWIGEARISLLNEKTQIESFSSNLKCRLTQNLNVARVRAIDATMQVFPSLLFLSTLLFFLEHACLPLVPPPPFPLTRLARVSVHPSILASDLLQMLRKRLGCALTKPYAAWIEKNFSEAIEAFDEIRFYPYPPRIQQRLDHLKEKNAKVTEKYLSDQKRETQNKKIDKPKESPPQRVDVDLTRLPLKEQHPGTITWAKISGHNWWPAMIIDYRDCCMREPSFGCQWIMWYGDYQLSEVHHQLFLRFDKGIERMQDYVKNTKKHVYLVGVLQAAKFYCTICAATGTVIICDKEECPRVYCTACMKHLLCPTTYEQVLQEDPWECFLCNGASRSVSDTIVRPRSNWKDKIIDMFRTVSNSVVRSVQHSQHGRKIRVLSLFDGLSTGLLVLQKLGLAVDVYYASEIDPDALLVSASHFGDRIVHLGDVRGITKEKIKEIAPIDLLIGGSPCNDLSLANPARLGLYDPNGTGILFFEYRRILELLKKINNGRHLFWMYENVASMPSEYRLEINKHLGQEPDAIDSADFSPQHRLRLYWHNLPIEPQFLANQGEQDVQDILTPHCQRYALVKKIRTVTTKVNSLKQGKLALKPILMKDESDSLWITELEEIFGFPRHYTDVKNLSATKRQRLIGKSWSVQTLTAILRSLCPYFECNTVPTD